MLTDFFILGNRVTTNFVNLNKKNAIIWVIGVIGYRMLMSLDTPIGSTLPVMIIIGAVCLIAAQIEKIMNKEVK